MGVGAKRARSGVQACRGCAWTSCDASPELPTCSVRRRSWCAACTLKTPGPPVAQAFVFLQPTAGPCSSLCMSLAAQARAPWGQVVVEYGPDSVDTFIEIADAVEEAFPQLVRPCPVLTALLSAHAPC